MCYIRVHSMLHCYVDELQLSDSFTPHLFQYILKSDSIALVTFDHFHP